MDSNIIGGHYGIHYFGNTRAVGNLRGGFPVAAPGGREVKCIWGKWFIQDPGSRMEEVGKEVREEEEEKQEDKVEVREGPYMHIVQGLPGGLDAVAVDACADGAHEVGTLSMWDVLVEKELRMAKLGSAGLYCDYSLEVGTECKVQRLCKWI